MRELMRKAPVSPYLYWPKSLLADPHKYICQYTQVLEQIQSQPIPSQCDHFIFENRIERHNLNRSHRLKRKFFFTPIHKILYKLTDPTPLLQYLSMVDSPVEQIYCPADPFERFVKHRSFPPKAPQLHDPIFDYCTDHKPEFVSAIFERWPELIHRGVKTSIPNCEFNPYHFNETHFALGGMGDGRITCYQLFDVLLNAGLDMINFTFQRETILHRFRHTNLENLRILQFFITRGLMKFYLADFLNICGVESDIPTREPMPTVLLWSLLNIEK